MVTPKPRTPSTTYRAVHKRVQKARGPASSYPCAHCQGTAHHWAYDHADKDELVGPTTRGVVTAYSLKPEHYRPMCRSCHTKEDRGRGGGGETKDDLRQRIAELERELADLRSKAA